MATIPIYNMTDVWNSAGTAFTAIQMDVTDTGHATGSALMKLAIGGATKFSVDPNGTVVGANFWPLVVTLTDGASVALDASQGAIFKLVAGGDRTIAVPTNPPATGKTQKIIIAHQASGANRTLSLTTGAGGFRFGTSITSLSATTSALTDYIGAIWNETGNRWDVVAYSKGF